MGWPSRFLCPWDFPGKNTGVGSCSLLQGVIPTQESNQGLWHCRRILYQLSYQGSPYTMYSIVYSVYNTSSRTWGGIL